MGNLKRCCLLSGGTVLCGPEGSRAAAGTWGHIPALGPHPGFGTTSQLQGLQRAEPGLTRPQQAPDSLRPRQVGAWGCRPWWELAGRGLPLRAEGFEPQEANKKVLPLPEVMGLAVPKGAQSGCWAESLSVEAFIVCTSDVCVYVCVYACTNHLSPFSGEIQKSILYFIF